MGRQLRLFAMVAKLPGRPYRTCQYDIRAIQCRAARRKHRVRYTVKATLEMSLGRDLQGKAHEMNLSECTGAFFAVFRTQVRSAGI